MKNKKSTYKKIKILLAFALVSTVISCERDLTDDAVLANYPKDGDVFIDAFSGLDYFPFVDAGADPEAFSVVTDEVYAGSAAIRFDVPTFGNGFVGATFASTGKRDLSGFDALTFYAKASQAASINDIGFGINGETNNKYQVTVNGLEISTNWKKYIIPIPDPSKLIEATGLFWLSEGASTPDGEGGYILWFDEIKFENLGTIGQPQPAIYNGVDVEQETFAGLTLEVNGLTQTFNLANGENKTVTAAPSYFDFFSSESGVVNILEPGQISAINEGETIVTAAIGGVLAQGSLALTVTESIEFAPNPTQDPGSVISIFSDAYNNIPVSRYNSFFEPFQTTLGGVLNVGDESLISYTDLNFVGIVFNDVIFPSEAVPPVNANNKSFMHIDIYVDEELQSGDKLLLELTNYVGGTPATGSYTINGNELESGSWVGFDIPLADFSGLSDRSRIGLLLFNSLDGPDNPTISKLFLDNIYFY